jgi:formate/nitrite transporter FocA (FNT family)
MGASVLLMGAIERAVGDADWNYLAIAVGYPAGFLLIAMARMQLFTETRLTAVLPVTQASALEIGASVDAALGDCPVR